MAEKKFIKIDSVNNEDGNALFEAICKNVLNEAPAECKELLGIPKKEKATTQDVISLLQNSITEGVDISVEITVKYTKEVSIEDEFADISKS